MTTEQKPLERLEQELANPRLEHLRIIVYPTATTASLGTLLSGKEARILAAAIQFGLMEIKKERAA